MGFWIRRRRWWLGSGTLVLALGLTWAIVNNNTANLVVTNDATNFNAVYDNAFDRYSATLNGYVNPGSDRSVEAHYYFEYKINGTAALPTTVDTVFSGNNVINPNVSTTILDLLCDTNYSFRIVGYIKSGTTAGPLVYGDFLTFKTPLCRPPSVVREFLNDTGITTASLGSIVNLYGIQATVYLEYGPFDQQGLIIPATKQTSPAKDTGAGYAQYTLNVPLSNLKCNSDYGMKTIVKVTGKADVTGAGFHFKTKPCPLAPKAEFVASNVQKLSPYAVLLAAMITPNYTTATGTFAFRKKGETNWVALVPQTINVSDPARLGVAQRVIYHLETQCQTDYEAKIGVSTEFFAGPNAVESAVVPFTTGKCGVGGSLSREVAAGRLSAGATHALLVRDDGSVMSWGNNATGQLGFGANTWWVGEVALQNGVSVFAREARDSLDQKVFGKLIAAGSGYSMANTGGVVAAWGDNSFGQLGVGATLAKTHLPDYVQYDPAVSDLAVNCDNGFLCNIAGVAAGRGHALAVSIDGRLFAWGENRSGQLGDGTQTNANKAREIDRRPMSQTASNALIRDVAAGVQFSVARTSDAQVYAWGSNTFGQLGNASDVAFSTTPVQVGGVNKVVALAAGAAHAMALADDGRIWAWGANESGQLGREDLGKIKFARQAAPVSMGGIAVHGVAIAAGAAHGLALLSNGTVYAWGDNSTGQLGDGTTTSSSIPVEVKAGPGVPLPSVVAISAGDDYSLAMLADGSVYGWGNNRYATLGSLQDNQSTYAVPVSGPSGPLNYFSHKLVLDLHSLTLGAGTTIASLKVSLPEAPAGGLDVQAQAAGKIKLLGADILHFDQTNWNLPQTLTVILDRFDGVAGVVFIALNAPGFEDMSIPVVLEASPAAAPLAAASKSGAWDAEWLLVMAVGAVLLRGGVRRRRV